MMSRVSASQDQHESDTLRWNLGRGDPPLAALRHGIATTFRAPAAEIIADLQLIVTELVTNAYEHGWLPDQIRITTSTEQNVIRVEVDDHSFRRPQLKPHSTTAHRGRGMQLVDTLASRWGVTDTRWGKTVWAEVTLAT